MPIFIKIVAAALCMLLVTPVSFAYPERPLTLVVPYPATGLPDIEGVSRISKLTKTMQSFATPSLTDRLAQQLSLLLAASLNQAVNIERHPAGNTISGTLAAVRAKPDGHTLLFVGNPTVTILPFLDPHLPFNPQSMLVPVAKFAGMPIALIAASGNPAGTVRRVIERARASPGRINYSVTGEGTTANLVGELFRTMAGIDMVHVNYNGGLPAVNALVTQDVEFSFVPLPVALPFIKSGTVRIVALTAGARHPEVPTVPTFVESGLNGFDAGGWFGVFTPAGTPGNLVSLLNAAVNKALSEEFVQRPLIRLGLTVTQGTPENFRGLIENDRKRWAPLFKMVAASP